MVARFLKDQSGSTAIEYGLLLGIMAALIAAARYAYRNGGLAHVEFMIDKIADVWHRSAQLIANHSDQEPGRPGRAFIAPYWRSVTLMNTSNSVRVGKPVPYTGVYGYQKRKLEILDAESNSVIGYVKEEVILDEAGKETTRVFYTRSFSRPSGKLRFYASPEALLMAFGMKIARATPVKKTRVKAKPKSRAKAKQTGPKSPASRVKKAA